MHWLARKFDLAGQDLFRFRRSYNRATELLVELHQMDGKNATGM